MNPYESQPPSAFWRRAVGQRFVSDIADLWTPKFQITPEDPIATFGSCFAQHFGQALRQRGFSWLVTEPAPFGMNDDSKKAFGYEVFSCRTGNIYTASLLRQWLSWAAGETDVPDEVWETGGRFYDPFRPRIEPNGFHTADEVLQSRRATLDALLQAVKSAKVFAFTLGLTESWFHATDGYEYPLCPGTAAGTFDADKHIFKNQSAGDVETALLDAIQIMRKVNNDLNVIITVSPVPLAATKTDHHVLVANTHSKSVLRAVAGSVADSLDCVDYFPSFEIINSPVAKGAFYEPDQRSVSAQGVRVVMDTFFHALHAANPAMPPRPPFPDITGAATAEATSDDPLCDEEILDAFGDKT